MKRWLVVVAMLLFLVTPAIAESLVAVEELTELEQLQMDGARAKLREANENYDKVAEAIATAHKMKAESWMEWSSRYEIKGKFILFFRSSYMGTYLTPNTLKGGVK